MTHPAEKARVHIMAALDACQNDPLLEVPLGTLTMHLAKAQKKLFPASNLPADSPGCIELLRLAMDSLAHGLKILQDLDTKAKAVQIAAASIARALQSIHPLVEEAKQNKAKLSQTSQGDIETNNAAAVDVNTMLSLNTDHHFYTGFSENIEEGGIFVSTFDSCPKNSDVVVNFKLPGNIAISAKGIVQFVRIYNPDSPEMPPGMGVKFTQLLPKDKLAIEKFLHGRAAVFYDD